RQRLAARTADLAVDGLAAARLVDEGHVAAAGRPVGVPLAPDRQLMEDRQDVGPRLRRRIAPSGPRSVVVVDALQPPCFDQVAQVVEAPVPVPDVAEDEQHPRVPQDADCARDRAQPLRQVRSECHRLPLPVPPGLVRRGPSAAVHQLQSHVSAAAVGPGPVVVYTRRQFTTSLTKVTTMAHLSRHRIHPAWWVAIVAFLALFAAAGFRGAPGAIMVPLHTEFGWSMSIMSVAMSINLVLY